MTQPAKKEPFSPASGAVDERSAHALEHIAFTLEAIEGHLRQMNGALGGQGAMKQLTTELQGVKNAILGRVVR